MINGKNTDQRCLAIRIHHSLADGFTFTHLLDTLCGKKTKYLVENFNDSFWDKVWLIIIYNIHCSLTINKYIPIDINHQSTIDHCKLSKKNV